MRIITIIGARPQFIKAAMVSHAILSHNCHSSSIIEEKILHTGQHYDYNMSNIFFEELHIPAPTWHLGCTGGVQEMVQTIVPIIQNNADYVLVYGDTNSTLAGALAAEQCGIPIIHIEAGLRSYNMQMAEEYNRIETDKRAHFLFCPTLSAVKHLHKEGITENVYQVGDVMYDAALTFGQIADSQSDILSRLSLHNKNYLLATLHRAENTNSAKTILSIFQAFEQLPLPVVLPLHPRTKNVIHTDHFLSDFLRNAKNINVIEPVSYIDMIMLEKHAFRILTDSGGVQKEAYFHSVPCITLRNETEWVETIDAGWNILAGTTMQGILNAYQCSSQPTTTITEYGTGHTATTIIDILCKNAY